MPTSASQKVFIGADHRGFKLKNLIARQLQKEGYDVEDLGTFVPQPPCDYPKISDRLARKVVEHKAKGILICLTGIGHCIAANKIRGAYAALCYTKRAAQLSRQHNNANVLVIGAKFVQKREIAQIVRIWLKSEFAGGRHQRRFRQIQEIEKKFFQDFEASR